MKKFSDRSLNFKTFNIPEKIVVEKKPLISTEFSDIITSYEKLKNQSKDGIDKSSDMKHNLIESDIFEEKNEEKLPKTNRKNITLQQLKQNIQNQVVKGEELQVEDKIILDGIKEETEHNVVEIEKEQIKSILSQPKFQAAGGITKNTQRDYSHLMYPHKIMIPKKIFKQGYTYKLNDCYYDSDGRFLYRVPGMA